MIDAPVVIAGGGPIGMTLALELASHGVATPLARILRRASPMILSRSSMAGRHQRCEPLLRGELGSRRAVIRSGHAALPANRVERGGSAATIPTSRDTTRSSSTRVRAPTDAPVHVLDLAPHVIRRENALLDE